MEGNNELRGLRGAGTPAEADQAPESPPEGAASLEVQGLQEQGPNTAGVPMSAFGATPEQYWGIDTSFDHVTTVEAKRLYDAGVRVGFQCIWTGTEQPEPAVNNIRSFNAVGIIPCAYLSVTTAHRGVRNVELGYDGLPDDVKGMLVHVACDVEWPGVDYNISIAPCSNAIVARGYPRLYYTSYNAWKNMIGDPAPPNGTLLWNAFWDNDSDFDFERFPYGQGRFVLIGEQYTGGENVEGVFADRNLFTSKYFHSAVPEPVPAPTAATLEEFALASASFVHLVRNGQGPSLSTRDREVIKEVAATL